MCLLCAGTCVVAQYSVTYNACDSAHGCCALTYNGQYGSCTLSGGYVLAMESSGFCKGGQPMLEYKSPAAGDHEWVCLIKNVSNGALYNTVQSSTSTHSETTIKVENNGKYITITDATRTQNSCIVVQGVTNCCGDEIGQICYHKPGSTGGCYDSPSITYPGGTTCLVPLEPDVPGNKNYYAFVEYGVNGIWNDQWVLTPM